LKELKVLLLSKTQVTAKGVNELKRALEDCTISH